MIRQIIKEIKKIKTSRYVYGYVYRKEDNYQRDGVRASKITGKIEFLVRMPGSIGSTEEEYWHEMCDEWQLYFSPYKE